MGVKGMEKPWISRRSPVYSTKGIVACSQVLDLRRSLLSQHCHFCKANKCSSISNKSNDVVDISMRCQQKKSTVKETEYS